ncbi:hypothetical protein [Sphingobacterium spiritivorum]|uniref:hypothetical protein n=1 Tax=Sphingobacterium spiritivorum TaxID=258 RepID=UPI00216165EF|nr:hypothetical protein [Sphingobacterium spiritivorum]
MAKEIITHIRIQATPLKIWSVFTEFAQYPQWNPFIKSLYGDVRVGKKNTCTHTTSGLRKYDLQTESFGL